MSTAPALEGKKSLTGISGLDEITSGGLPRRRATLVCGGPGCGKTTLAMEFLVHGARDFDAPGIYVTFEQSRDELLEDYALAPFELGTLAARDRVRIVDFELAGEELIEAGAYDLSGLFARIDAAIKRTGAQRIVLDSIDSLFAHLRSHEILRAEFSRLLRWLKERGLTVLVTAERGDNTLTRHGLEEYVADCVIFLDHRVDDQVSTRRLRIVKYRGSAHGDNEFPFLIDTGGLAVLPITSLSLDHEVTGERIATGAADLDAMLGGQGIYRTATVLLSGTAGTGKSSLAAHFAMASYHRGERCLYYALEESAAQIQRNMASIGIDLKTACDSGLVEICAQRPTLQGLEVHLVRLQRQVEALRPAMVIVDPVTNMTLIGTATQVRSMLTRLIDFLKSRGVTIVFTSLTGGGGPAEQSEVGISSLIDTWLVLTDPIFAGVRTRSIQIIKSRGMAHDDNQRRLEFTDAGIRLHELHGTAGADEDGRHG